jgi:hypothetical protein
MSLVSSPLGSFARAKRVHSDRQRARLPNSIRDLNLALCRQSRGDDILGDVASVVARGAIYFLWGSFPEKAPPPWLP